MFRKLVNISKNVSFYRNLGQKHFEFKNQNQMIKSSVVALVNSRFYSNDPVDGKNKNIDKERQTKIIDAELSHMAEMGKRVPDLSDLTSNDYKKLLTLSPIKREKHYNYLFKKYNAQKNDELKKAISKQLGQINKEKKKEEEANNAHINYGLGKNTIYLKIYKRTLNKWLNHKVFRYFRLGGPQIIFDCGFEDTMNDRELHNVSKQLRDSFGSNRRYQRPFWINYCNLKPDGRLMKFLMLHMPTLLKATFPIDVHEKCYTEIFPNERLVYLTPHANENLKEFNPNDIYIIGAIVDKGPKVPTTLAQAKKLNIRTAKLPLDQHLKWKQSNKVLTLDQITKIMCEIYRTGDWNIALKHVPSRKTENGN